MWVDTGFPLYSLTSRVPFSFGSVSKAQSNTLACHSAFLRGSALLDAASACRLRIRRPGGGSRVIYWPPSITHFLLLLPPHPCSASRPLLQRKRTCATHPSTHTKWPHTPLLRSNCFPPGTMVHILLYSTLTTVTRQLSRPKINSMGLISRTSSHH